MSLHESSDSLKGYHPYEEPAPPPSAESLFIDKVHKVLAEYMVIEDHAPIKTRFAEGVAFRGQLTAPPAEVYKVIDEMAEAEGFTVYTQRVNGKDEVIIAYGVLVARNIRAPWWLHMLLLIATILTTTVAGSLLAGFRWEAVYTAFNNLDWLTLRAILRDGAQFSLPLLLILGTHEMGHYVAARLHNVNVTLPFFLPLPLFGSLGTLGAVIFIKSPFRSRKMLFDVGIAGPLAGLVAAIIVFLWGLQRPSSGFVPIVWIQQLGINRVTVPPFLEWVARLIWTDRQVGAIDRQIFYNYPTALAGWFGIILTTLNLLPLGQFDGGHVAFALFGRRIAWPLAFGAAAMCIFLGLSGFWIAWMLWPLLAVLTGLRHPPPHDDISPLGWPRMVVGVLTFLLFPTMIILTPFYSTIR